MAEGNGAHPKILHQLRCIIPISKFEAMEKYLRSQSPYISVLRQTIMIAMNLGHIDFFFRNFNLSIRTDRDRNQTVRT